MNEQQTRSMEHIVYGVWVWKSFSDRQRQDIFDKMEW